MHQRQRQSVVPSNPILYKFETLEEQESKKRRRELEKAAARSRKEAAERSSMSLQLARAPKPVLPPVHAKKGHVAPAAVQHRSENRGNHEPQRQRQLLQRAAVKQRRITPPLGREALRQGHGITSVAPIGLLARDFQQFVRDQEHRKRGGFR